MAGIDLRLFIACDTHNGPEASLSTVGAGKRRLLETLSGGRQVDCERSLGSQEVGDGVGEADH